ncbi:enoyl-CoA hydratase [Nibricoccus aquaticus]|uniref:Enoyl-CoA hydratase n=1 Tax=Nibricoccus aquaticus TaxID=2576891 RepID=A0A290Q5R3_9BACT|nr:crotonase/enoyl-CoA hydratase family protein [Nibricoccus aquaticus]ATC64015.1 enoyl-CoA hydratase [Nibricoccus aquaticus]
MHAILSLAETQNTQSDIVLQTESLTARYDESTRTLWNYLHASPRPCFTESLLADAHQLHSLIRNGEIPVDFYVAASAVPKVFNLGGDLSLFRQCALDHDWERLTNYAESCIGVLNDLVCGFDRKVISISLLQGDALGGGFESALATDFMIAEEQTKMGFPEVLFNLFPGMGAYSLLARKLGPQPAQRMILSGSTYSAPELHARGLLDQVTPPGQGEHAVRDFIRDTRKRLHGYRSFLEARRRTTLWTSREELLAVVHEWVASVKQISERDLRLMDKLVTAQNRLKLAA